MATRKVIMFGGAGTKEPVPEIVPGVERWVINNLIKMPTGPKRCKGATQWFDLHWKEHIESRGGGNVWATYQKLDIPLYMWKHYEDLPTSTPYPIKEIQAFFGGTRLFTSSLDYMVAKALFEGYEEIELYAFRMGNPLYRHQVSSGRWWLKQCADRGVRVTHLSPSTLNSISREVDFKPPRPDSTHLMYGLETTDRSKLYRGR